LLTHPAATETYPLSLHDALPISEARQHVLAVAEQKGRGASEDRRAQRLGDAAGRVELGAVGPERPGDAGDAEPVVVEHVPGGDEDRKSTRLNSSHVKISYAVFCL